MNTQQARLIDMPDLLSRMGYQPYEPPKKGGRELWYLSPLPGRQESVPSFHITLMGQKWVWKDFGADKGGNVIDFIVEHQNTDFKGAMKFLRQVYQADLFEKRPLEKTSSSPLFSFQEHVSKRNEDQINALQFLKAFPVQHPAIFQYLKGRGLREDLVKQHLLEIRYLNKIKNKVFFGFGMKNESGGYELRSASDKIVFKSALIKRDLTLMPGTRKNSPRVYIFEGMLDALSLLSLNGQRFPNNDYLILHSTSSYTRAKQFIEEKHYSFIHTLLDNDEAGERTLKRFRESFGGKIIPQNHFYRGYKDVNAYLQDKLHQNTKTYPDPSHGFEPAA